MIRIYDNCFCRLCFIVKFATELLLCTKDMVFVKLGLVGFQVEYLYYESVIMDSR